MIDNLLHNPREGDGHYDVEHQSVVDILFPGDGDEELAHDGMGHEHRR